jgi:hypothetical protein
MVLYKKGWIAGDRSLYKAKQRFLLVPGKQKPATISPSTLLFRDQYE